MASRGVFIVFEGLDGSGTSTQARILHETLVARGLQGVLTSEPTNGPIGSVIRHAMTHRLQLTDTPERDDQQLAYLFAADRFDHLYNSMDGVLSLLERGTHVVSTRYYLSSYAYHCNSEDDFELVYRLNSGFPLPDLTFYVNTPIEVCLDRIHRSRSKAEKYETREKLTLVECNYRSAIARLGIPVVEIDGSEDSGRIAEQIYSVVESTITKETYAP